MLRQPNLTPKTLFNPLKSEFIKETKLGVEGDDPVIYTIPSLELKTFPTYLADHLAHYLAQAVVAERGVKNGNYEDSYKAALQEITVEI